METIEFNSREAIELGTVIEQDARKYRVTSNTETVVVEAELIPEVYAVYHYGKEKFRGTFGAAYDYRDRVYGKVRNPGGDINSAATDALADIKKVEG